MAGQINCATKALIFAGMLLLAGCSTVQQTGCNTVEAGCRQQCRTGDAARGAEAGACYERCAQQNTCRKS